MNLFRTHISKKLLSDGIWSILGNLVSVVAGVATVKIVTNLVDTSAFGQASLALGLVALISGFIARPVLNAHNRAYFDYRQGKMGEWFVAIFNWILGFISAVIFLIYIATAIVYYFFKVPIYLQLVIPVGILTFSQTYLSALAIYIEANRQQRNLAFLTILQRGLAPFFLYLLLLSSFSQVQAIVMAQVVVAAILLLLFRNPSRSNISIAKALENKEAISKLKDSLLSFSWTLALSFAAIWVVTTSDRYLIGHFLTLDDVGVYSVNYTFWSLPFLMLNGWLEILMRPIIYDKATNSDWEAIKKATLLRIAVGFSISIVGSILIFFLNRPLSSLLLSANYSVSDEFVIVIALAHCFYVLGNSVVPIFLAAKKAQILLFANVVAALLNFAVNLIAIPAYGITGATIATLIAYIIWAAILLIGSYTFLRRLMSEQKVQIVTSL